MGKLDRGFAIGAVAAAVVVGGVIFALYPASFGYGTRNAETSTASSTYVASDAPQTTNTAAQDSSTASQKATDSSTTAGSTSTPQPSGNSGY